MIARDEEDAIWTDAASIKQTDGSVRTTTQSMRDACAVIEIIAWFRAASRAISDVGVGRAKANRTTLLWVGLTEHT